MNLVLLKQNSPRYFDQIGAFGFILASIRKGMNGWIPQLSSCL